MEVDVFVEIPKGSRNKYEWDEKADKVYFSRRLFSSVGYPTEYGFITKTHAPDDDPLDALVLSSDHMFPGCYVKARPVGMLRLIDGGEEDNKVLCVPITDPMWNHIKKLKQVPPHLLREIRHFFEIYKSLEKKKVNVLGWAKKKETLKCIKKAQAAYHKKERN